MNQLILNQYGITLLKHSMGYLIVEANSNKLSIYIEKFADYRPELEDFISTLNLALSGNYGSIDSDKLEWTQELGDLLYTGIIKANGTFDLFMEGMPGLLETYPLSDIKEIFTSVQEFMGWD